MKLAFELSPAQAERLRRELHRLVLQATGSAPGIRDLGALESAIRVNAQDSNR